MEGLGIIAQAGSTIQLGPNESYELSPLNLRDWATLEEESLSHYKRQLIKTYTENYDLLPEEMKRQAVMEAFSRAEKITTAAMPKVFGKTVKLDSSGDAVMDASGLPVMIDGEIPYSQHWMDTFAGKLHSCWLSIRKSHPNITLDQAGEIFRRAGMAKLAEAAQRVAELSRSKLKNASSVAANGQAAADHESEVGQSLPVPSTTQRMEGSPALT